MTKDAHQMTGFYAAEHCDLSEFTALVSRQVDPESVPLATETSRNVPVYHAAVLQGHFASPENRRTLMAEWAGILRSGAGVFVLKQAQPDHGAIDDATAIFETIIANEKAANATSADHFAAAGSNDRIWNSLQKLCLVSPETFIRYFASPAMDAACEAWLGPNYQMTAQVNLVHPGGQAQQAHRDYHLGFQTAEVSATYPAQVHDLSPLMTLQSGLAHCDVPIDSGPTKLLPFSHLYQPGYAAWRRDDFRACFEDHFVQIPLDKGDAIFFNPALFHAAGENRTSDIHRMVNLFQISSAFGRAMESVDRLTMCKAIHNPLRSAWDSGNIPLEGLQAVIAATAEGYSFPTNLDRDPPVGGLAPETQAALMMRSIISDMPNDDLVAALDQQVARKQA